MTVEVEFRREMNRNYMVIVPENGRNETCAVRMLTGNKIPGFLPFHEKQVNGEKRYYYDITSKQPLDRILEYRKLTGTELERLISDLIFSLRQIERFFLDENCMDLKPEFIYVEPDSFKCCFCYLPGKSGDFPKAFCELSQYLLDHVNHRDGDAVVLAFAVFRECRKENFGIEDIEKCLRKGEGNVERNAERETERKIAPKTEREADSAGEAGTKYGPSSVAAAKIIDLHNVKSNRDGNISAKELPGSERYHHGDSKTTVPWMAAAPVPGMVLLPVMIFILRGMEGLIQYKWILGAAELLLGAVLLLLNVGSKREERFSSGSENNKSDEEPWEVYFREEDARDTGGIRNEIRGESMLWAYNKAEPDEAEDEFHTVLLTARPIEQEARKLVSVSGNLEISIGYFPFIIGKSKGMVDFCLNEPGVSRLHIKIEENDTGYFVTDLNSTNGTRVNGKLLEANETCSLTIGSELEIASRKFKFQ